MKHCRDKLFSAVEISSMILRQMRETAETNLGQTIRNAVITCPAYFSDAQRRATMDACVIAELNVLRILNEPTAAAIAYGFDNLTHGSHERKNVLIFVLGAGTLDVSLFTINNRNIIVKATAGDTHLGGEDFDNNMVGHFVEKIRRTNHIDISDNPSSMRRLRLACERAKRLLSVCKSAQIEIASLYEGIDFETTITRDKFEDLNEEIFSKCLDSLERCLWDAKMSKFDVDEVVLVGGSTRIAKVQKLLTDFFNGKKLNQFINPDLAVTLGATICAAMLVGEMPALVLLDVTPLSLGIELKSGIMSVVIPRNTPYPVEREKFVTISRENQTSILYDIYEGEKIRAKENNYLGCLKLSGIAPAPAFTSQIKVTFRIDADGILHVSAVEMIIEDFTELNVTNENGSLSQEEIGCMIEDGRRYKLEDEQKKMKAIAQNELGKYVYRVRKTLGVQHDASAINVDDQRKRVESAVEEIKEWRDDQGPETEASEYDRKRKELETIFKAFEEEPLFNLFPAP